MFKYVTLAVVALIALQAVSAKSVGTAPDNTLDTLYANAQKTFDEVAKTVGLENLDSKKVVDTLNSQAKIIAGKFDETVAKLKATLNSQKPEIEKAIKEVQTNLAKASENLNKLVGPEVAAKGKHLKDTIEANTKEGIAQIEKLVKAVQPGAEKLRDDAKKTATVFLDELIEIGKSIENKVKAAAH